MLNYYWGEVKHGNHGFNYFWVCVKLYITICVINTTYCDTCHGIRLCCTCHGIIHCN